MPRRIEKLCTPWLRIIHFTDFDELDRVAISGRLLKVIERPGNTLYVASSFRQSRQAVRKSGGLATDVYDLSDWPRSLLLLHTGSATQTFGGILGTLGMKALLNINLAAF